MVDASIRIPDKGGRAQWNLLQVEGFTKAWDNLYVVFATEVQHPDELGFIAIDDVSVLDGECQPMSCGFQDDHGKETFCLWEQVTAGDNKDWILNKGPSPNWPYSGPLREPSDLYEKGCYTDNETTVMEQKWLFETNNSQKACIDFIRETGDYCSLF